MIIGDFNELTGLSEKEGGAMRSAHQMEKFIDTLNWCGLKDRVCWFKVYMALSKI